MTDSVRPEVPASARGEVPVSVRSAVPADAAELVRLRALMLRSMSHGSWDDDWREPAAELLREQLGGAALVAFVVDRPDGGGLAACAAGTVERRLGAPGNPSGRSGYVFNVSTDPDHRRRGYSRACVTALLDWFGAQGIGKIDLFGTAEGTPLYRALGFVPTADPALRRITVVTGAET